MDIDTYIVQLRQPLIIIQHERQILVTDIYIWVTAQPSMLLLRLLSTTEPMLINLIFDLVWSICHEDTRIRVRSAHFRLGTLEGWEELGVDQGRFRIFELRSYVSSQTEIWVLVYRTWDETGYVRDGTKYLREGVGEGWCSLDSGEVDFPNIIAG